MAGNPAGIRAPGTISLWAGGIELAFENLTAEEIAVFDRDLAKMSGYFSQSRDLQNLFLEDRDTYLYCASIAKKQLGTGFGGVTPGSGQIGMQLIRSKLILGAANWLQTISAAGWNNIFGSSSSPVDLSSTSSTYGNPQNRCVLCIPKLMDICAPKITEAWFNVGPTQYPIFPIGLFSVADLFVAKIPAAVYVGKNGRFYMRGNIIGNGVVEGVAPLGICFALSEFITGSGQE